MRNRFFVAEARNDVESLKSCSGNPNQCEIALKASDIKANGSDDQREAYQSVLAPLACNSCVQYLESVSTPPESQTR